MTPEQVREELEKIDKGMEYDLPMKTFGIRNAVKNYTLLCDLAEEGHLTNSGVVDLAVYEHLAHLSIENRKLTDDYNKMFEQCHQALMDREKAEKENRELKEQSKKKHYVRRLLGKRKDRFKY